MYTPGTILPRFEQAVERMLLNQATGEQTGAFVTSDGIASGTHIANARFVALMAHCYLDPNSRIRGSRRLFEYLERALEFQVGLVRATGLIDLKSTNWQSPPDTAFTVQLLAPIADLSTMYREVDEADRIRELILSYVRRAAQGIAGGGFHTPNHRWVVCSALAYAQSLEQELDFSDYIGEILAEEIDINADGEYSERSTGIYTAVTNRALIVMADRLAMPELLQHVRASLDFVSRLFQPDGSVVTAMSSRRDRGERVVPQELADIFMIMGHTDGNDAWIEQAESLVEATLSEEPSPWLLYPYVRFPELRDRSAHSRDRQRAPREDTPERYFMPDSGLYRVRHGQLALTLIRDDHDVLDLVWGSVHVHAMRIAGAYFGRLRFEGRSMDRIDGGVRMAIASHELSPVGYYLPLGRPVGFREISHNRAERDVKRLPQFDVHLDVTEADGGLRFHLVSSGGLPDVLCQIEICIDMPVSWHTDSAIIHPDGDATGAVILQEGYGVVRSGHYAMRIGPGTRAHRISKMRGAADSTGWRVKIPLSTPIDYVLSLDPGYWSEPENRFVPRNEAPRL